MMHQAGVVKIHWRFFSYNISRNFGHYQIGFVAQLVIPHHQDLWGTGSNPPRSSIFLIPASEKVRVVAQLLEDDAGFKIFLEGLQDFSPLPCSSISLNLNLLGGPSKFFYLSYYSLFPSVFSLPPSCSPLCPLSLSLNLSYSSSYSHSSLLSVSSLYVCLRSIRVSYFF